MSVSADDMVTVLGIIARMNSEQNNEAWAAVKSRDDTLRKAAVQSFRAGDIVEFTHSKTGCVIRGEVMQGRARVNLKVNETHRDGEPTTLPHTWRVTATLLRPYTEPDTGTLRLPEGSA